MADWFTEHAPQTDWFAEHAPDTGPGVPNPLQANPQRYTPPALLSGKQEPVPTVGGEAMRNLPRSVVNYTSLGMTQPDTLPPGGIVNPITGTIDAVSKFGHMVMHPMESFAKDPIATINLPAVPAELARRGAPVAGAAARGAWQEGMSPTRIPLARFKGLPVDVNAPKSLAYGMGGYEAGLHAPIIGGPTAAAVGAVAGAGYPLVKGAIQGVREHLAPSPELEWAPPIAASYTKPAAESQPNASAAPSAPAPSPAAPVQQEVIKSLGYGNKSYDKLTAQQQSGVDAIMRKMGGSPAALPAPSPAGDTAAPSAPVSAAPALPAPTRPLHTEADVIDNFSTRRKVDNLARHFWQNNIPYEELKATYDKAKATGDWSKVRQMELEAYKTGKALEDAGNYKPQELVPKTQYKPPSGSIAAKEAGYNPQDVEGTWDRLLQRYPRTLPKQLMPPAPQQQLTAQ